MKKANVKVDLIKKTITMTTAFQKKAQKYGSEEYKELAAILNEHPDFEIIIVKATKKKENFEEKKEQLKKISYAKMKAYIKQEHSEDLEEFEVEKKKIYFNTSTYHAVLVWFTKKYNKDEAFKTFMEMQEAETANPEAEVNKEDNEAA